MAQGIPFDTPIPYGEHELGDGWFACGSPELRYFQIDYDGWVKTVYLFGRDLHISRSDIMDMPFFELLMLGDLYFEELKQQSDDNSSQQKEYNSMMRQQSQMTDNISNMNDMFKNLNSAESFTMPKFDMPKFDIPSF